MRTQQTRDVGPTLVCCWSTVHDVDPTVNQRCANVSCLLGDHFFVLHVLANCQPYSVGEQIKSPS